MAGGGSVQALVTAAGLPVALAMRGPGSLAGGEFTDLLIFDAGSAGRVRDPIALFYAEDASGLDWLEDYLRDARTIALVRDLRDPPEDEEEAEEIYSKEMSSGVEMDWST